MGEELSSPVGRGHGYHQHVAAGHLRRPHALLDRGERTRWTLDLGLWKRRRSPPSLHKASSAPRPRPLHRAVALTERSESQSLGYTLTQEPRAQDQATRSLFSYKIQNSKFMIIERESYMYEILDLDEIKNNYIVCL